MDANNEIPVVKLVPRVEEDSAEYQTMLDTAGKRVFNKKKFNIRGKPERGRVKDIWISQGNAFKEEQRLKAEGETFTVTRTNVTTVFKFPNTSWANKIYSRVTFTFKEMNLFAEIRKEVLHNIEYKKLLLPNYESTDIGYYLFSNKIHKAQETGREVFDDAMEFDIVKAYYMAAYNLGYISMDFFLKCIELPKVTRLRLIGSIATSKTIFKYENGKLTGKPEIKENEDLRKAWFHICKYVDEAMRNLAKLLGNDFLFYWVDGLYCLANPNIDAYIRHCTLKYGFDFEYKMVDQIVVERDEKKKSMLVKAFKSGEDPKKPTCYYLNNDGEVIRELKKFYIKNFPINPF